MKSLIPNLLFLFVILHGNSCDAQDQSGGGLIAVLLRTLAVIRYNKALKTILNYLDKLAPLSEASI